jgi:AcrR family transcriptional regulator
LIYHYFDSKVDLYLEVHQDCATYIFDRFAAVASDSAGLVDALCAIADDAVALHAEDPTLASFISSATADSPRYPELAELTKRHRASDAALWRSIVDGGIASGELPANVDRKGTAGMIAAIFMGFGLLADRIDAKSHAAAMESLKLLVRGDLLRVAASARRRRSAG